MFVRNDDGGESLLNFSIDEGDVLMPIRASTWVSPAEPSPAASRWSIASSSRSLPADPMVDRSRSAQSTAAGSRWRTAQSPGVLQRPDATDTSAARVRKCHDTCSLFTISY